MVVEGSACVIYRDVSHQLRCGPEALLTTDASKYVGVALGAILRPSDSSASDEGSSGVGEGLVCNGVQ